MSVDSSVMEVRMRLRGARQVQAENKATAASTTGVAKAVEAAGVAGTKAATGGISRFQRGMSSLKSMSSSVGSVVEAGMLRAVGGMEKFAAKADTLKRKGKAMSSTGRSMAYGMTLPLVGVGYFAIKTAANFEKAMAQVGIAAEIGGKKLQKLRDYAMEMGAKTIFSANDSAEAMLSLVKAGMTPAQIRGGALAATMSLAAAGGMELAGAGDLVAASMATFELKARDAVKIADSLAGGANASLAELSGLGMSLRQVGQIAASSGLDIHETVGTLAAFAQAGIASSDAGTSFKTFLMRLAPTTKKAQELQRELGLEFFDSQGRMKGISAIADELQDKLGGMSQKQRMMTMNTLFGSDAIRAATIIMNQGKGGMAKWTKATEEKGAAEKMANAQMKGLPGALERLSGSLETAALAAGVAFTPVIEVLAGGLEKVANWFTDLPKPMQTVIVSLLVAAAVAGPLVWVIGAMTTGVGLLATGVGYLGSALLFLAANPIILAIAAVLAIGVALFIAYKKVKWFHNAVDAVWDFIQKYWPLLIGPLLILFGPLITLAIKFKTVKQVAVDAFNMIKGAAVTLFNFFTQNPLGKILAGPFYIMYEVTKKIVWGLEKLIDLMMKLPNLLGPLEDAAGWVGGVPGSVGDLLGGGGADGPSAKPMNPSEFGKPSIPELTIPKSGGGGKGKVGPPAPRPNTLSVPRGQGRNGTLQLTIVQHLDGKEVSRNTTKHALDSEARS